MSRRKAAQKRTILADPLFRNIKLAKFMNVVMKNGKKSIAEKIVYGSLKNALEKSHAGKKEFDFKTDEVARKEALELFDKSLDAIRPIVEVKARRVGGATYQVPMEVNADRGMALAMRWLAGSAVKRGEKTMAIRLAHEMLDAIGGKGEAIKKRDAMHATAKANQAFSHFRW
jgi:small subunit ribosomal protein S7